MAGDRVGRHDERGVERVDVFARSQYPIVDTAGRKFDCEPSKPLCERILDEFIEHPVALVRRSRIVHANTRHVELLLGK